MIKTKAELQRDFQGKPKYLCVGYIFGVLTESG